MSYIDTIEGLAATHFPVAAPLIFAATLWRREENDQVIEVRVRVESPGGATLETGSSVLKLEPKHNRGRVNIGLGGYTLFGPGRYYFVVERRRGKNWDEAARLPFELELRPGEQVAERTASTEQTASTEDTVSSEGMRTAVRKPRSRSIK